jgi:uncharacterized membrane protein YphA (DoxX/SURF4 family)
MGIIGLLIIFGAIAIVLTLLSTYVFKNTKSYSISFLQYFCGVWFAFSGIVKAIDPIGTAFKMEQYFGEFETTAQGVGLTNLAKIFPWFSHHSIAFSIFMVVLEIVLGILLILGAWTKFTKWTFFLLVFFFTVLTGFTYMTGFVPSGENFFDFGKWASYKESNMKVTDCGCFGDFLKLHPKISFFKDLFLMIPALMFLFNEKRMHQLFSKKWRTGLIGLTTLGFSWFCFANTYNNEPPVDFRPFKVGVNIKEQREAEHEAQSGIKILSYTLKNKKDGTIKKLTYKEYIDDKGYEKYPEEKWEITDQEKTEPTVAHTKISDFEIYDMKGDEASDVLLNESKYTFVVVSYRLNVENESEKTIQVSDSVFVVDSIKINGKDTTRRRFDHIGTADKKVKSINWNTEFSKLWTEKINTFVNAAEKGGIGTIAIVNNNHPSTIDDFRHDTQSAYPFYTADDLVIKTIMRSNPGVLLMKNGKIINKWHYKQLPNFDIVKNTYIK